MNNKLYVHDDADPKLKETITLCQELLDNMLAFKPQADSGTLTLSNLAAMVQRNKDVSSRFPQGDPAKVGLPKQMDNPEQLADVAAARIAETNKLYGNAKPALKIDSIEDLHQLCLLPPESMGEKILAAEQKKKGPPAEKENVAPPEEEKDIAVKTPAGRFDCELYDDHLKEIVGFLDACKKIYYNLTIKWPQIAELEQMVNLHLDALGEHGDQAIEFLASYVTGDADDELEEKKPAAAFSLCSIVDKDQKALEQVLRCYRENEDRSLDMMQALKYGLNPHINQKLEQAFAKEPSHVREGVVEVLEYRQGVGSDCLDRWFETAEPGVRSNILRAKTNLGQNMALADYENLLQDPEAPFFEEVLFSALISGKLEALYWNRKHAVEKPDTMINLPLFLACSGMPIDYNTIKNGLAHANAKESAILALGIMGLVQAVPLLLDCLGHEEFLIQRKVVEALELITGAGLELPFPEIREGPEGKEHEVKVETGWQKRWTYWWMQNTGRFDQEVRYRRGDRFHLGSCIDEMEFERGNYWSRQYSYYELQIRSGAHVCHFEADWYVPDQKAAINKWRQWWKKKQHEIPSSQWLFAGKQQY